MLNIPMENVANFDEMNLDFSVEGRSMLNMKGEKTVKGKAGQSSNRAANCLYWCHKDRRVFDALHYLQRYR
jgi:hypothetical protein